MKHIYIATFTFWHISSLLQCTTSFNHCRFEVSNLVETKSHAFTVYGLPCHYISLVLYSRSFLLLNNEIILLFNSCTVTRAFALQL